jgi:WXXGXW repeat (2 copies)
MRLIRAIVSLVGVLSLTALPSASRAQVYVSITTAPPPLPVYVQPVIPGPDYMWVPGYWAWGSVGYYWVPGTWVLAPGVGMLWTPGYWGWNNGYYVWRAGYWGPRVGYYGGINYGYGYTGLGYQGGYWSGRVFTYNTAVVNVGTVRITNVYTKTVVTNTTVTNVSFNGGKGGITAQPTPQELAAGKDKHIPATGLQTQHEHAASTNRALFASVNHGKPDIAATAKAGQFAGAGIVAAKGANPPGKALAAAKGPLGPQGPKQPPQFKAARMAGPPGLKPPLRKPPGEHAKKPGQP